MVSLHRGRPRRGHFFQHYPPGEQRTHCQFHPSLTDAAGDADRGKRMYLETLASLLFHFSLTFPDRSNPDYNNLLLCAFGALHFWLWDSTLIHIGRSIDTMMRKPISRFFSKLPVSFAMRRQPPTSSIPGDLSEVF